MRVLHVITKLELGGAQQNTLHTCRELARRGHDVTLVAGPGGMLDDEAARGPFAFRPLPSLTREIRPWRDLRALFSLAGLIRELRPDVVHLHSSKAGALGRIASLLARATGRRHVLIHSIHGWSFAAGMPKLQAAIYRVVEHACAPMTHHFIAVSRRDLELGIRLGIVPPDRGSVIRSGFDLKAFDPAGEGRARIRAEWGIRDDEVLVVNVSNFKPQKAPLDFVRAAAIASRERGDLRFAFVGDGELRADVEAAVIEGGLRDRMVLAGWRHDTPEILRAADVFALSSLWEGLPRSVVQARACGLPVVATAVNGTPEVVDDGVTGWLVPPGDPAAMAGRLIALAKDPALRRAMGERARQGLAEFSETAMVDDQERLYRDLVSKRGPSRAAASRVK